jgi:hypothetical protein
MQLKQLNFNKLWHNNDWIEKNIEQTEAYNYNKNITSLAKFEDNHPEVMKQRIETKNWKFDYDISYNKLSIKDKFKNFLYNYLNIDLSYRNYQIKK